MLILENEVLNKLNEVVHIREYDGTSRHIRLCLVHDITWEQTEHMEEVLNAKYLNKSTYTSDWARAVIEFEFK